MRCSESYFRSFEASLCPYSEDFSADSRSYAQFDDPALNEHFNLVCLELRGHGRSKSPAIEEPYVWEAAADDLYEGSFCLLVGLNRPANSSPNIYRTSNVS
jgi:hypothetical protein